MQQLTLPSFDYRLQKVNNTYYIFDRIRKKYVHLTPEEWVRQHFVHYLINHLAYPKSLIRLESGLRKKQQRTDILIYDRTGKPLMIVECKGPSIPIDNKVFDQAARYNMEIKAKLLVVTNGLKHFCCKMDYSSSTYAFLEAIPCFNQL